MKSFRLTPYARQHRSAILDLMYYHRRVHNHLDWYDTEQWLDMPDVPVMLAWDGEALAGMIALSRPLNDTCWVRLMVVHNGQPPQLVLATIWDALCDSLKEQGVKSVSLLIVQDWLSYYVRYLRFNYLEDIVTLRRLGALIPECMANGVTVRSAEAEDLDAIVTIDQTAFLPPWQLNREDLRQAERHAASYTVAILDNQIVGYQLSTRRYESAHLARLAVLPDLQGRGVGAVLLDHLVQSFLQRGVRSITVNTQASNERSQRLYRRYGFRRTGYDLPVWVRYLND